jgi:TonB-linked SusC/RagA family outer membrane protein
LELSTRWSQTKVNGGAVNDGGSERGSTTDTRLKNTMIYPSIPVTGDLADPTNTDQGFMLYSPITSLNDNDRSQIRRTLNLGGSASYEFIDGFKLRTEVGLDQSTDRNDRFYGITTYYVRNNVPAADQMHPAITFSNRTRQSIRNTNTLNVNFKKWMPKNHSLNLLLGQEMIITTNENLVSEVTGFDQSFTFDMARRLSNQGNALTTDNNLSPDDKLLSYFARLNYDFSGKYLLAATFRADGSSKFGRGHRWGYFPSVSAAWRISAEPFMKSAEKWLYDLKLRASYGTAGNNAILPGQMAQSYESKSTTYINGYDYYWAPSTIMANRDLKWETTITRNIGLDWALFNGKLNGTLETYLNTTKDLLILFPVGGTGYSAQYRNMGETQNKGIELAVNWVALDKKDYGLTLGANIGFNKNKINSLGQMTEITGATNWASTEINNDFLVSIGGPVGQMFGYRSDGRYEVSDFDYNSSTGKYTLKEGVVDCSPVIGTLRPGSMKLKDLDGSGTVTEDYADREVIGDANPLHTGGFNINARAYGFDLGMNFNWSYGNDVYNANKIEYTSTSKYHSRNMIDIMAEGNRWTNLDKTTGQLITDPEALAAANANTTLWSPYMKKFVFSDWAVEDGSFLRLNTLTLGYTLPTDLTKKAWISTCRFYVTGYNVYCWTNYSGFDPEVNTRRKVPFTPGVDYAAYPRSRKLVFGINLTF